MIPVALSTEGTVRRPIRRRWRRWVVPGLLDGGESAAAAGDGPYRQEHRRRQQRTATAAAPSNRIAPSARITSGRASQRVTTWHADSGREEPRAGPAGIIVGPRPPAATVEKGSVLVSSVVSGLSCQSHDPWT